MVEAVAVVVEAGFGIEVFCREAVSEEICKRAGLQNRVAEGVVCVLRNGVAGRVEVARYVAVVVVERNIELAGGGVGSGGVADSEVEQSADSRRAVARA